MAVPAGNPNLVHIRGKPDRPLRHHLAVARGVVDAAVRGYADGGPHLAGAIAFRVLFSIVPLVIVLVGAFSLVVNAAGLRADVVGAVVDNAPLTPDGQQTLRDLLEGATGRLGGLGLLGVLGLVWSASGMMGAIRFALNRAWHASDSRPFLQGKAIDVLLVLGVGVLVALSFATALVARVASRIAGDSLDRIGLAGAASWLIGLIGSGLLAWAAVAVLFQAVPNRRTPWRSNVVVAGAVGLVVAVLQNLYGIYLGSFGDYNAIYGSLGAIVALLFYVYLAASVLVLGAEAAAAVPAVRARIVRGDTTDDGEPLGTRIRQLLLGLVVDRSRESPDDGAELAGRDESRRRDARSAATSSTGPRPGGPPA